jgi:hypothetical protein
VREHIETIFRAATAFFFLSIWGLGGVLLTPELKTDSNWIATIQLGIAAGMLSRRTMPLSALGIFTLFAVRCGITDFSTSPIIRSFSASRHFLR